MPRLFTALRIPDDISRQLALLRGGPWGARWVEPEDYHITLSFIGKVDAHLANDIIQALRSMTQAPFWIEIERLDAFGRDKPKSVYASVKSSPALLALQAAQDRLLRQLGVPLEKRQYKPHITLASLKDISAQLVAEWLTLHEVREGMRFFAERFVLMSSREPHGGGPYLVEEVYPLGLPKR